MYRPFCLEGCAGVADTARYAVEGGSVGLLDAASKREVVGFAVLVVVAVDRAVGLPRAG